MSTRSLAALLACALATAAAGAAAQSADKLQAPITLVNADGTGKMIGNVTITESKSGLVFTPKLSGLPAGSHGYHVHETGNCSANEKDGKKVPAGAAGGHLDPQGTKHHAGPTGNGHLGDLPPLVVSSDGNATTAVTAPRLTKLSDVKGKALMIHAGGDNYSDKPKPLGGGGDRIACGVIE
jgi:superoxide dismutase, Cu-Zn family